MLSLLLSSLVPRHSPHRAPSHAKSAPTTPSIDIGARLTEPHTLPRLDLNCSGLHEAEEKKRGPVIDREEEEGAWARSWLPRPPRDGGEEDEGLGIRTSGGDEDGGHRPPRRWRRRRWSPAVQWSVGVTSKGWRVGTREADKTISTWDQRMRLRKDEDKTRMRDWVGLLLHSG
jgi:hypothetical protein